MKKNVLLVAVILFTLVSYTGKAQFNPYASSTAMFSAGFGASGWGLPIFVRYEHPVADNITVGGTLSFQTKGETFGSYKWKHTITGINGRGSYHVNELLDIPEEWDLYGGLSLGYYIWNTKYNGPGTAFDYTGSGSGGFSVGAHIGGRYFINEKMAVTAEIGGGSVLAGGTVGITFLL